MTGKRRGGAPEITFGKRVDGPTGRRRARRNSVAIRGEMVIESDTIEVTLIDMSNTGAKLHGAALPAVGQLVLVRIGPMEASGTVSWSEGELCGVHFASPAADDDVDIARRDTGYGTLTALAPTDPMVNVVPARSTADDNR